MVLELEPRGSKFGGLGCESSGCSQGLDFKVCGLGS